MQVVLDKMAKLIKKTLDKIAKQCYNVYTLTIKLKGKNMQNIKSVTTRDSDNVELYIDLTASDFVVNNCKVTGIAMTAESDGGEFCCGDLAVLWEAVDDSNYADNTTLLMRDANDKNDNTATMGAFYWENAFDETLTDLLLQNGFSESAANDVCTSEWGMQEVGYASYDANLIAQEMLAAHNIKIDDEECAYCC